MSKTLVNADETQEYPQGLYYAQPSTNTFYTNETSVGTRFNVTFYAFNLSTCWAYQVQVYCDPTMLNITRAWRAQWDPSWVFYGHITVAIAPSIGKDARGYYAKIGDSLQSPEIAFNASGILGIVEFNITAAPAFGKYSCELNITNTYSYWLGPTPTTKHYPTYQNSYYEYSTPPVEVPSAKVYVDPSRIVDPILTPCKNFSISVKIMNATDLYSFEFKMSFNSSLLNAKAAVLGDFFPPSVAPNILIDNTAGYIHFSASLSASETPKSGNGTLAIIEFHVEGIGKCDLHLYDVKLRDQTSQELPHEPADGYFNNELLAKLAVDPPEIIDPTLLPPKTFTVNITIDDVENLYGYGFNLTFNPNVLICLQACPQDVLGETHYIPDIYISNTRGFIWVEVAYYSPAVPITTYTPLPLINITFRVKNPGVSLLNLTDTSLTDSLGIPIPHEVFNGFVMTLMRDLAITNVVPSRSWAYASWPVNINVTAKNLGNISETFNVRAYANDSLIGSQIVSNLPSGQATNLTFMWDTTGLSEGNYIISAEADIVPYEINLLNNEFTDGSVTIITVRRDVAILNVVPSHKLPYEGWIISINVTAKNLGEISESFDVKAYCNTTLIGIISITLDPSEEVNITFTLNTAIMLLCHNYTISAEATLVPFEYDTTNNIFTDGIVKVRIMGDLNNDGQVDISDVASVAYAFGAYPEHSRWDANADLNCDEVVDISDVALVAYNFGRTCC
jgi:hypothetical protein